ncbi:branched-chain amino acid ABC transporter permease [Kaustia mangrovi]|uniref:Branched-chain amino acid ABC transporter permease n=1 Tax=Kaustia mangrovi TaxID=2593653 RepID=A0A7S8HBG4_9HYPH|nr:branched-chain amino acid ABC transporter permease [Kaustia mangrovi]QPC42464.1 branched-chain amino acid ABC transporter permease [Kaustia mangrovi]
MLARIVTIAAILVVLVAVPPLLDIGWQNAMTNMLIASLFAVAFNLLIGQAGLLSFGHAAFFGVGAFATLHLMVVIEDGGLAFPTPLLPLAGAAGGFVIGAFAGYFATMRSGVYFALVTLAIAELFHSLAPHWDGLFGGEAGLSSMRMPWGGLIYGSPLEVYYLALGWTVLSVFLLWAYTRTPFGRLTLALRDNEQRVRFMGYNAHSTKVIIFAVSAMFSGVAGALLAISNETANYTLFSTHVSAQVVLHTFVGGSTVFFGPVIGASVFTLFAFFVSDVTRSWLLYQGLIFVLVMLYAPHGIGGLVDAHRRHWSQLRWSELAPAYGLAALSGLALSGATIFLVETFEVLFSPEYAAARRRADGAWPPFELFGLDWQAFGILTWAVPVLLAAAGLLLLPHARRALRQAWDGVLERTEADRAGSVSPELAGAAER